jgi:hypothetical protein
VDDPPVVLPRHGVFIALAQEAHIIRLHQLVDAIGITVVLPEIILDRAGVLLSAVYRFLFLIAADGLSYLGRRYGQRNRDQQDHNKNANQEKSLLVSKVSPGAGWCRVGSHG